MQQQLTKQQPTANGKQQQVNNILPEDNKEQQEEIKPAQKEKQPPVNNVNNSANSPITEDFVKYEVITTQGSVPFVIYNGKELTLRQAKQRLSVAQGRLKTTEDTKGTNKRNEKIFSDIIKSFNE